MHRVCQTAADAEASDERCQALLRDNTLLRNTVARLQQQATDAIHAVPPPGPTRPSSAGTGANTAAAQLQAAARVAEQQARVARADAVEARKAASAADAALAKAGVAQAQLRQRADAAAEQARAQLAAAARPPSASVGAQAGEELWRPAWDAEVAAAVAAAEPVWGARVADARAAAAGDVQRMRAEVDGAREACMRAEEQVALLKAEAEQARVQRQELREVCREREEELAQVRVLEESSRSHLAAERAQAVAAAAMRGREASEGVAAAKQRMDAAEAKATAAETRAEHAQRVAEGEAQRWGEEVRSVRRELAEREVREAELRGALQEERRVVQGLRAEAAAAEGRLRERLAQTADLEKELVRTSAHLPGSHAWCYVPGCWQPPEGVESVRWRLRGSGRVATQAATPECFCGVCVQNGGTRRCSRLWLQRVGPSGAAMWSI